MILVFYVLLLPRPSRVVDPFSFHPFSFPSRRPISIWRPTLWPSCDLWQCGPSSTSHSPSCCTSLSGWPRSSGRWTCKPMWCVSHEYVIYAHSAKSNPCRCPSTDLRGMTRQPTHTDDHALLSGHHTPLLRLLRRISPGLEQRRAARGCSNLAGGARQCGGGAANSAGGRFPATATERGGPWRAQQWCVPLLSLVWVGYAIGVCVEPN